MSELPDSVVGIAQTVTSGELSATSVIAAHLERATSSQADLNAYTLIETDEALAAAKDLDDRISAKLPVGPLAGVPIAIKDLIDHAGRPNTAGSSYPAPIPSISATVVTRLEQAGAIVIGRTGLHEYAFGFSSENHWFDPVRNPWDRSLSPGGSSGGTGSAVSAGTAAAGLGTDTGGSVRVPAALCGVVGLKVTHGRVPLTGVFPLAPSLDTIGPLAKDVTDAAAVYGAIAGYDAADPWSVPRPVELVTGPARLDKMTFGVPHPWVDLRQDPSVAAAFASTVEQLRRGGATIVDLDLPDLVPGVEIEHSVYPEVAAVHERRWHDHPETYGPDVSERLGEVFNVDPKTYVHAQQWRAKLRNMITASLDQCDVLMTPAVASHQKPIGQEMINVDGKEVSYRPILSRYSALVNHTGLPAIALPLDMDGTPPPSVQLIGKAWDEHRLLAIGLAMEQSGISRYRIPPLHAQRPHK